MSVASGPSQQLTGPCEDLRGWCPVWTQALGPGPWAAADDASVSPRRQLLKREALSYRLSGSSAGVPGPPSGRHGAWRGPDCPYDSSEAEFHMTPTLKLSNVHQAFRPLGLSLFLVATLAAVPSWALSRSEQAEINARYKQERAACMTKTDAADRTACLQDAVAAQASALRNRPKDLDPDYTANQVKRCQALPTDQRSDCVARMRGQGTSSGSVEKGGIYRELVTIVPGSAAPAATPASAAPSGTTPTAPKN